MQFRSINSLALSFLQSPTLTSIHNHWTPGNSQDSCFFCCCCCPVAKLCLTPCDPMNCTMPGFPYLHRLPEFPQTPVHGVGDAIQPSHPLLSPSPLAVSLSQHQRSIPVSQLFASGGQSIGDSASASVLSVNIQG